MLVEFESNLFYKFSDFTMIGNFSHLYKFYDDKNNLIENYESIINAAGKQTTGVDRSVTIKNINYFFINIKNNTKVFIVKIYLKKLKTLTINAEINLIDKFTNSLHFKVFKYIS